jgi:hypothetical protein
VLALGVHPRNPEPHLEYAVEEVAKVKRRHPCSLGGGRRWHRRGSVVLASFLLHCGRLRLRPRQRGVHGAEAAGGGAPPEPANRGAPPPSPWPLLLVRHGPCFASAAAHLFLRRRRGAVRRRGRLLMRPASGRKPERRGGQRLLPPRLLGFRAQRSWVRGPVATSAFPVSPRCP